MPPASRGTLHVRIFNRQLSSTHIACQVSRPSVPPRPKRPTNSTARIPQYESLSAADIAAELPSSSPGKNAVISLFNRFFPHGSRGRWWLRWLAIVFPGLYLSYLHFPLQAFTVNGPSMCPTFNGEYDSNSEMSQWRKDDILVQSGALKLPIDYNDQRRKARGEDVQEDILSKFERGQIVVFRSPNDPSQRAVKRIVAIPGDRVTPRTGSPGGDEAVVVPWNHVWVEGDNKLWRKSKDSNWYGPISQNLIIGEVKALTWKYTWMIPRQMIYWREHTWPAKEEGRVEYDVVARAGTDPDAVLKNDAWTNGRNKQVLQKIKDDPERLWERFAGSEKMRSEVRALYRNAALVVAAGRPDSNEYELAEDMIKELEKLFGRPFLMEGMLKAKSKGSDAKAPGQTSTSTIKDEKTAAFAAEKSLHNQGWALERDQSGAVKTFSPS